VVCFYGCREEKRIRGYLLIQELVKEKVARKYQSVASVNMAGKAKTVHNLVVRPLLLDCECARLFDDFH